MPTYIYKAKSQDGREKSGVIEANSSNELAWQLRQEGYFLVSATPVGSEKISERFWRKSLSLFSHVSLAEKMVFARHLAAMIKAGLSLDRGLQILAAQTQNPQFRRILTDIEDNLRRGQNFSYGLQKYPKVFSELFINMVKVGETSGNLEEVLKNLASQMEKDYELRSKVKGAMIYPAIVISVMIAIGILMMVMVVPKLASTFEEVGVDLPWTTKIVITVSQFLAAHFIIGLFGLVIVILFLKMISQTKAGKKAIDYTILNVPPFSQLSRKVNSARFARNLGSLINAGVPIITALQIVAKTMSNSFFQESLFVSSQQIQKGEALSKILQNFDNLYPIIVIQMIEVGETTGSLSEILRNLAEFYEEEVSNATKNLSSIIEPALMVIIGIVVGFFAISIIQPIYGIMGQL